MEKIESSEEIVVDFVRSNLKLVVFSILLMFAVFMGYSNLQKRKEQRIIESSNIYSSMLSAIDFNETQAIQEMASILVKNYKKTIYAQFAALQLAKTAANDGNLELAKERLQWVQDKNNIITKSLATTRMARILIKEDKITEALEMLEQNYNDDYAFLFEEVRAQAFLKMNDRESARSALSVAQSLRPTESSKEHSELTLAWLDLQLRDVGMINVLEE